MVVRVFWEPARELERVRPERGNRQSALDCDSDPTECSGSVCRFLLREVDAPSRLFGSDPGQVRRRARDREAGCVVATGLQDVPHAGRRAMRLSTPVHLGEAALEIHPHVFLSAPAAHWSMSV